MNERIFRLVLTVSAVSALGWAVSACRPAAGPAAAAKADAAAADGKRHPITGTVVSVLRERGTLLLDHEEIPGYMPRMTMEFSVSAGDLALAKDGAALRATLVEGKPGEFRLEGVWWETPESALAVKKAAASLREETGIRGRGAYREVGENLPDFALYNQNGEVAQAARWRGKQVMLNFIFTRCPIATMCPASTMRMMETQRLAREAAITDIEFVSITLDPEYDTPGVLREYAETRGIDTTNFSLLTGPEGAIKDLLKQFGILTEMDGPILKHTLATLLINEEGRIIWRADGSGWEPKEFVEKMRR